MRYVEHTIPKRIVDAAANNANLVTAEIYGMLRELGDVEDGGLFIRIWTGPKELEKLETVQMFVTGGAGGSWRVSDVVCACGYEPKDLKELTAHFQGHGGRRLIITPDSRGRQ